MPLLYYTQYSIEFHCYKRLMLVGFNTGVGTQLMPTESIEKRQAKRIHELALRFSKFVREARLRLPPRKEVTASASHISAVKCEKP